MDCLALVLQPVDSPQDLLLQTKPWFPPARARAASQNFLKTRAADSQLKQLQQRDPGSQQAMMLDRLGDDPLAAASGQVIVGGDRSYRVVYRLVNCIYVLGIALADDDDTENVFQCITAVNQAVSVLVAAGKGVEVTPEKIFRKYTEVYIALRYILNGIGGMRLQAILAAVQGDGAALLSPIPFTLIAERENRGRGSTHWSHIRSSCVQRLANVEVLSTTNFELPEEILTIGDEAMQDFAPPPTQVGFDKAKGLKGAPSGENDPFAASDSLLLLTSAAGDLSADLLAFTQGDPKAASQAIVPAGNDPAAMLLAELEAPGPGGGNDPFGTDPAAEAFGEELGDASAAFGGDEDDTWGSAFSGSALLGGDSDAWGGGLDAAEFGFDETETLKGLDADPMLGPRKGYALETVLGLSPMPPPGATISPLGGPPAPVVPQPELPLLPTFRFEERISVEFVDAAVKRVRLQGTLFLGHRLTPPAPKPIAAPRPLRGAVTASAVAAAKEEENPYAAEFSFRLDGAAGIYRAVVFQAIAETLGRGYFRVKLLKKPLPGGIKEDPEAEAADGDFLGDIGQGQSTPVHKQWAEYSILKYRLLPRFTPIPLRIRTVTRKSDESLSIMVQYVANPYLQSLLEDVVFSLSLPFSPASLKLSPSAELDPWTKQVRWKVPPIKPDAPPQRLRAQIPVIPDHILRPASDEELTEEQKKEEDEKLKKLLAAFKVSVSFKSVGGPLSGISILEAVVSTKPPFQVDDKSVFKADSYLCS